MDSISFNAFLRLLDIGDESALLAIKKAYSKQISCHTRSIFGNSLYVKDILSRVISTLWNKSRKFQNIINPDACIFDLTKKTAISFYRTYLKKHENDVRFGAVSKEETAKFLAHNDDLSDINFLDMIKDLDDMEKEIIVKKIVCRDTHAEIAKDLNMPQGTVKWKYQNILNKLRNNVLDDKCLTK